MKLSIDLDEVNRIVTEREAILKDTREGDLDDAAMDKLYERVDELDEELRGKDIQGDIEFLASGLKSLGEGLEDLDLDYPEDIVKAKKLLESLEFEYNELLRKSRLFEGE